jgi:hypothetical protein
MQGVGDSPPQRIAMIVMTHFGRRCQADKAPASQQRHTVIYAVPPLRNGRGGQGER